MIRVVVSLSLCLMMIHLIAGYQYEMEFEENIFVPCKDFPDHYLTKYIEFPKNYTVLPDDRLYISGDIVITSELKQKTYPFILEYFKKGRGGAWEKTIYSFRRNDLCTSLFDTTEMWSTYTKKVPLEQQKCPLTQGQIFSVDYIADPVMTLPSTSLEGDYLAHFEMGSRADMDNGFLCVDAYFRLYRI